MKYTFTLLILIILFSFKSFSQVNWQWVQKPLEQSAPNDVFFVKDANNNFVIAGNFSGPVNFSGNQDTSIGMTDFYFGLYDSLGNNIWLDFGRALPSKLVSVGRVGLDNSGNIILVGYFDSLLQVSTTTITRGNPFSYWDMFVAKFTSSGTLTWIKQFSSDSASYITATNFTTDSNDNIYLCGELGGTAVLDGNTISSSGTFDKDIYIAKLNSSGTALWAKSFGGLQNDELRAITLDPSTNEIIIGGAFKGSISFDGNSFTSQGQTDIFLVKTDNSGNVVWAKKPSGPQGESINGITLDQFGNIHITGGFYQSLNFTGVVITENIQQPGANYGDAYIAKFSPAGTCLWAKSAGSFNFDNGEYLSVDNNGNVYMAGAFYGYCLFNSLSLTSSGATDGFIAKYDSNGLIKWVTKAGGVNSDFIKSVIARDMNRCWLLGYFSGSANFGSLNLSTTQNGMFMGYIDAGVTSVENSENVFANWHIFPNPGSNYINLIADFTSGKNYTLNLINTLGQVVYSENISNFSGLTPFTFDVSRFSKGLYTVTLSGERVQGTHKLSIE